MKKHVPQWIDVNESLPLNGEIVLAYNQVSGVNQAEYNKNTGTNGFKLMAWGNKSGAWYPYITHWMPLPCMPIQRIS